MKGIVPGVSWCQSFVRVTPTFREKELVWYTQEEQSVSRRHLLRWTDVIPEVFLKEQVSLEGFIPCTPTCKRRGCG